MIPVSCLAHGLAENIIADDQAGFRHGIRTIEHISNLRILCENISNIR